MTIVNEWTSLFFILQFSKKKYLSLVLFNSYLWWKPRQLFMITPQSYSCFQTQHRRLISNFFMKRFFFLIATLYIIHILLYCSFSYVLQLILFHVFSKHLGSEQQLYLFRKKISWCIITDVSRNAQSEKQILKNWWLKKQLLISHKSLNSCFPCPWVVELYPLS